MNFDNLLSVINETDGFFKQKVYTAKESVDYLTPNLTPNLAPDFTPNLAPDLTPGAKHWEIIKLCAEPQLRSDILQQIGLKNIQKNADYYIKPLITNGWLEMTSPDKPNSRFQKYRTTGKGLKEMLNHK